MAKIVEDITVIVESPQLDRLEDAVASLRRWCIAAALAVVAVVVAMRLF